ncbi:flavodoxin [Eisenbergiella sp.]
MTKGRMVIFLTLLIITLGITACGNRTEGPDGGTGDGADTQAAQTGQIGQTEQNTQTEQSTQTEQNTQTEQDAQPEQTKWSEQAAQAQQADTTSSDPTLAAESEVSGKALIVYFSWSGNTEKVAAGIQSRTGADIFEIVPQEAYTEDYDSLLGIAQEEQKNGARPAISDMVENMDGYDLIYVGFPNWWGDMPMILYSFFDEYDLSGKTIAPFCTSGGSGLSDTVRTIKTLEPDALVLDGLHIGSSEAADPESAVKEWLDNLGLAE